MIIPITDADDERIAPWRDIRERDLVRRDGLFIAEGKTVLQVLVHHPGFALHSLLILKNRLEGVQHLLDALPDAVPVYVAESAVMDAIAGFAMHRGVLALAHRPTSIDQPPSADDGARWRRVVAVCGMANHDNMGALFRNAAAFGADAVLMDKASCDPFYRKAIRVSVGGVFTMPIHRFDDGHAMLTWLDAAGITTMALSPRGTHTMHDWTPPPRCALLLGAEGPGLPDDLMARCQTLRIAMNDAFDSLNVATAAAIALHHLFTKTG